VAREWLTGEKLHPGLSMVGATLPAAPSVRKQKSIAFSTLKGRGNGEEAIGNEANETNKANETNRANKQNGRNNSTEVNNIINH